MQGPSEIITSLFPACQTTGCRNEPWPLYPGLPNKPGQQFRPPTTEIGGSGTSPLAETNWEYPFSQS